eukprot:jgi/Ulvmu1/8789/UM048_0044.1
MSRPVLLMLRLFVLFANLHTILVLAIPQVRNGNSIKIWRRAHDVGPLPELGRPEHGQLLNSSRSVGICAIMKSENHTDVSEWLSYYRWLGVEHVYLTENANTASLEMQNSLGDFISQGFITYSHEPDKNAQLKVYHDCMRQHYNKHGWLAFFDLDEYLVLLRRPEQKLADFLDVYREHAGLAVHWVLVGPSGRQHRARCGGVLRHYTRCAGHGSPWIKTIANTRFLTSITYHPHSFEFRDRMQPVNELHQPVPEYAQIICSKYPPAVSTSGSPLSPAALTTNGNGEFCSPMPAMQSTPPSVASVALFHYITKSREDFGRKRRRGAGDSRLKRAWAEFDDISRSADQEGGICAAPAARAALCCPQACAE